jgi:pimeloyl-ACP methyl ester carboxylesterase
VISERDVRLEDGRLVHAFDTGSRGGDELVVVWHHGSPQTGAILEGVGAPGSKRGIRLVSYGRPSYGGSTPQPGRSIGSAAADVAAILDDLGIERFATVGASGGGPHALACAALLDGRVIATATLASPTPYTEEFDWFAGMVSPGGPKSALEGREARARYAETEEFDSSQFIAADWAALEGEWADLGRDAQSAERAGPDGLIDDDVALVTPWGFDLSQVAGPVLLVQGGEDRVIPAAHGHWLLGHIPTAQLWLRPRDGHVSVLRAVPVAMDWLIDQASNRDGGAR